ncbi:MAG: chemotaxis protein CheA, partial [Lachnospiraceae bacterium]
MDVSQYLEIFIDETNEHLQNLTDCIMSLEKEPENMDTINEIFRAAHSLKGMAGTMGFKRMQHLTHDMENVFQEVRSGNMKVTSGLVDVLFQCLDAIDTYLESVKESSDEGTEDNEAIIQELNNILEEEMGTKAEKSKEVKSETKEKSTTENRSFDGKFSQTELSEKEKESIRDAEYKGLNVYGITVYIQEECLLKAARAFLVFKAVEEYGEILAYNPSSQDIEDEKFDNDFSFYIQSENSLEKILEVSKDVSEIEEVVGEKIKYSVLTDDTLKKESEELDEVEEVASTGITSSPQVSTKTNAIKQQIKASVKKQAPGKPVTNRTVRVDIEKLDALMNQVSELIIAKNSLVSISTTEGSDFQNQTFHEQIEYLERITTNLHESVMKVRMVPIESVVNKFPRMIRDLAKKLDKQMELIMTGEDTELDRTVVDQIGDPLQHLLRNSADHGLESSEVRLRRGKPESGTICLNAFQEGNNVIIEVSDDGNGIDTENVKAKAIERGLITPEQGETLNQKEIIEFLFMPSFS